MALPANFQFSQGSLQDYVDCPRRFELRYLERIAWPALETEPALENERYMQHGREFHRMVHQHLLGIPQEKLAQTAAEEILLLWWNNYLTNPPSDLPASKYPETPLSAPVGDHRLMAKYDLVATEPATRAVIVDWKTSRKRTRRDWLAARLQTRVYPYLLVKAGAQLNNDQPIRPEQVEMVYWFSNFAQDPEHFEYDAEQYEADEAYLTSLITEISALAQKRSSDPQSGQFPLTTDERRCQYCPYRSLCRRGIRAGAVSDIEDELVTEEDLDFQFDFDQIAEIEYR
jgi:hypothetical protein